MLVAAATGVPAGPVAVVGAIRTRSACVAAATRVPIGPFATSDSVGTRSTLVTAVARPAGIGPSSLTVGYVPVELPWTGRRGPVAIVRAPQRSLLRASVAILLAMLLITPRVAVRTRTLGTRCSLAIPRTLPVGPVPSRAHSLRRLPAPLLGHARTVVEGPPSFRAIGSAVTVVPTGSPGCAACVPGSVGPVLPAETVGVVPVAGGPLPAVVASAGAGTRAVRRAVTTGPVLIRTVPVSPGTVAVGTGTVRPGSGGVRPSVLTTRTVGVRTGAVAIRPIPSGARTVRRSIGPRRSRRITAVSARPTLIGRGVITPRPVRVAAVTTRTPLIRRLTAPGPVRITTITAPARCRRPALAPGPVRITTITAPARCRRPALAPGPVRISAGGTISRAAAGTCAVLRAFLARNPGAARCRAVATRWRASRSLPIAAGAFRAFPFPG